MPSPVLLSLCVLVLVGWAAGDVFTLVMPNTITVGTWSDYAFITAPLPPFSAITVTPSTGANCEISPSVINLNPTTLSASFRLRPLDITSFIVSFTIDGDLVGQFTAIPPQGVVSVQRVVNVDSLPGGPIVGIPTDPLKISLSTPSTSNLQVVPVATTDRITFDPSVITIPAGSIAGSFRFTVTSVFPTTRVGFTLVFSGNEANLYSNYTVNVFISPVLRSIIVPSFSPNTLTNNGSSTLYLYTPQRANGSIDITPTAADTVFSPPSVRLDSDTSMASFTFQSSTPNPLGTQKIVTFLMSGPGADYYAPPPPVTLSVPKKTFYVDIPRTYTLNQKTTMSIRIPAVVSSGVTVQPFAANLQFDPVAVSFTGTVTALTIEITPTNTGADTITFLVTGSDQYLYDVIGSISISVLAGSFVSPAIWYNPQLWVGVKSDPIPVRINIPPTTSVTLTPTAADLVFDPPSLEFTPDEMELTFTITPSAASTQSSESVLVNWMVSGPDYAIFVVPDSFFANVNKRKIQYSWSSDITGTPTTLYAGKSYGVWFTASYVGDDEEVTVTCSSPFLTFSPLPMKFSSGTLRVFVTATVTAGSQGGSFINYIIGGDAGGYYDSLPTQQISVIMRPLSITAAVVSFDSRLTQGVRITGSQLTNTALTSNHLVSLQISTDVIPDDKLTIKPVSPHITFEPSSFDVVSSSYDTTYANRSLVPSSLVSNSSSYRVNVNFTATGQASGIHDVWFQLSGGDALYYAVPPHTPMGIKLYVQKGSASSLVPFASVIFALVALVFLL